MPASSMPTNVGGLQLTLSTTASEVSMLDALTAAANRSEARDDVPHPWTPAELAARLLSEAITQEYVELMRTRRTTSRARIETGTGRFRRGMPEPVPEPGVMNPASPD